MFSYSLDDAHSPFLLYACERDQLNHTTITGRIEVILVYILLHSYINHREFPNKITTMGNTGVLGSMTVVVLLSILVIVNAGDMMRKSIVFDKNTPDVFYCPQHKPTGFDKMIVKAKPLSKLCQFDAGPIPEDYKSDCYNDVDETEYACKEKYRIMKRLKKMEMESKAVDNDYIEK